MAARTENNRYVPYYHRAPQPARNLSSAPLDKPLKSIFEIFRKWNMVDSHGLLTFASKVKPHALKEQSLYRFNALMQQQIRIKIGRFYLTMTQKEYAEGLNRHFTKSLGKEVKTYLRGGYALYVLNMPEYFEELIQDFLAGKEHHQKMFQEIEPFLNELKLKWKQLSPPTDVDWLDCVDCSAQEAEFPLTLFFSEKEPRLFPEEIKKNAFSKHVKTYRTHTKMESGKPFLIYTLNTEKMTIDRASGNLRHTSLASFCDLCIPLDCNTPESLIGNFPQVICDWGTKSIRIQDWHSLNFPALAAFCQYTYQGYEFLPNVRALTDAFTHISMIISESEEAYQELIKDIDGRMRGHRIEEISFLFSIILQFYLVNSSGLAKIWKEILPRMHEAVKEKDREHIDFRLVKFFHLFQDDFSKLISALVHLSVATPFSQNEFVSISQVLKEAVIFKIGSNHFYFPKHLFEQKIDNSFAPELEGFLSSQSLKLEQKIDRPIQEMIDKYHRATNVSEALWNPYLLFIHLSKAKINEPLPSFLKSYLKYIVDSSTPKEDKERLLAWMAPWYIAFNGRKSPPKGVEALSLIAKTSIKDACVTFDALDPKQKRSLLVAFLCDIQELKPEDALDRLIAETSLSEIEKATAIRGILKRGTQFSKEFLLKLLNVFFKTETGEEIQKLFPYMLRRLWDVEEFTLSLDLFLFGMEKNFISSENVERLFKELKAKMGETEYTLFCMKCSKVKVILTPDKIIRPLNQEEQILVREFVKELVKKDYRKGFHYFESFFPYLYETTHCELFLEIFRAGKEDKDFILEFVKTSKCPLTSPTNEIKREYLHYIDQLLKLNFFQAVEFLFSPLSFKLLTNPLKMRQSLFTYIQKELSQKEPAYLALLKQLFSSMEENSEIIGAILEFFAENWSRSASLSQELKKILEEYHPQLVPLFEKIEKTSSLRALLHLLNLLSVKSSSETEDAFVELFGQAFSLPLFVASLQNHRFPPSEKLTKLLLKALVEAKNDVKLFKTLLPELPSDTCLIDLVSLKRAVIDAPLAFEALVTRFITNTALIAIILAEDREALKAIPSRTLCHLMKEWNSLSLEKSSLHALLDKVLLEEEDLSLLSDLIVALNYKNIPRLQSFFPKLFQDKREGMQKIPLEILMNLDPKLDHGLPEYRAIWRWVLEKSYDLKLNFSQCISLADDHLLLTRTETTDYKELLVIAAIKNLESPTEEEIVKLLKVWKELEFTANFLSSVNFLILKFLESEQKNRVFQEMAQFLKTHAVDAYQLMHHEASEFSEKVKKIFSLKMEAFLRVLVVYKFDKPKQIFPLFRLVVCSDMVETHFNLLLMAIFQQGFVEKGMELFMLAVKNNRIVSQEVIYKASSKLSDHTLVPELQKVSTQFYQYLDRTTFIDQKDVQVLRAQFYTTQLTDLLKVSIFEKIHWHILRENLTTYLSLKHDLLDNSREEILKNVLGAFIKSLPHFDGSDSIVAYMRTLANKGFAPLYPDLPSEEGFRILSAKFLRSIKRVPTKKEVLFEKVFMPFLQDALNTYTQKRYIEDEVFFLRDLFYFSFSYIPLKQNEGQEIEAIEKLGNLLIKIDETGSEYVSLLFNLDIFTSKSKATTVEYTLQMLLKFRSNENLERVFYLLKSVKTINFECFQLILQAFEKILNSKVKISIHFFSQFLVQFRNHFDEKNKASYGRLMTQFIDLLHKSAQRWKDLEDFNEFIKIYCKACEFSLEKEFVRYEDYLTLISKKIEDPDPKVFSKRMEQHFKNAVTYEDSSFVALKNSIIYWPKERQFPSDPSMTRRHLLLANWISHFMKNPTTREVAYQHLALYINCIMNNFISTSMEDYLNRIEVCLPIPERFVIKCLPNLGEALATKTSSIRITQRKSDVMKSGELQARSLARLLKPYVGTEMKQEVNRLIQLAVENKVFTKPISHYFKNT